MEKRKLFCELGPAAYRISQAKERLKRRLRDMLSGERFADRRCALPLPCVVKAHRSVVCRALEGVDMRLQRNKETNLRIAADKINGLVIEPGESFSFWRLVGRPKASDGYLPGLTICAGKLGSDVGGGLCQLANMVHWLVLNSPMTVTELHHHTDALFPDSGRRVPFGTGTGVFYNYIDYRFRNTTDRPVQLLLWLADGDLCGELRSPEPFPYKYRLEETDACYRREGEDYYRCSRVWRVTLDADRRELARELLMTNHSRVLYDHALIPPEEIADPDKAAAV